MNKVQQLPNDQDTLQQMIIERDHEIDRLRELVKLLQQRKFGRKTEKTHPDQLPLFDGTELSTENSENEVKEEDAKVVEIKTHSRKQTKNRKLPKDLPREQKFYDLSEEEKTCQCGCKLTRMGEDKYEQLDYIPAKLLVIEHVKAKYSCKSCQDGVKTATMPKQPIPKSIASAGLLSQVITSKYLDHLPLYRQEAIFSRLNINLSRTTLGNWIFKSAKLLEPLVDLLKKHITSSNYARADETTVNVISEQKNRTNCYMWVFMAGPLDKQAVVFEYHPSRQQKVATQFFEKFTGYLQTDAYSGYNELRSRSDIIPIGCWAHARRKFFEITKMLNKIGSAHIAVKFINKLYAIEHKATGNKLTSSERKFLRQTEAIPILLEFKEWLDKTYSRVPPRTALYSAITYTLNNWVSLNNYCLEGFIEPDNNAIERMIKPFACGRKNWLFQGNTKGAEASAVLYSLAQTCKVNGIEPYLYFRYVLERMPQMPIEYNFESFLPFNLPELKIY